MATNQSKVWIPALGLKIKYKPNNTDIAPVIINIHSLDISALNLSAIKISTAPIAMAHAAT